MSETGILQLLMRMDETSRSFFSNHNFSYDINDESTLEKLEFLITLLHPEPREIPFDHFIPFAYYLGQVITNNIHGACWDDISKDVKIPEDMTISITLTGVSSTKLMLYPMRRIARFIHNREDSISSFYQLTKKIVAKNIDLTKTTENTLYKHESIVFEVRSTEEDDTQNQKE